MRKNLLIISSLTETATGLALIFVPGLFLNLLIGINANETETVICRVSGIALLSLGLACFPYKNDSSTQIQDSSFIVLLMFNLLLGLYFFYFLLERSFSGVLLLPAAIYHFGISLLFIYQLLNVRNQEI